MSNLTMKDLDYEKIMENYNKVEELENRLDDLEDKIIPLINKLGDFVGNVNSKIDERIKLYIENKESNNNSIEKLQTESVEPKKIENNKVEEKDIKREIKEKKLDISKFIEEFSQEFEFINKDEFNEEMENDEIMGKIIELIKKMLGVKNNKINEKEGEINKLNIKKTKLESDIAILSAEKENLENNLKSKKEKIIELEEIEKNLKKDKFQLEEDIKTLNAEKRNLENNLNTEKERVSKLEKSEKILTDENYKLIKDKEDLNRENREKDEKLEKFMKLFEEKEKELESIGDLLQAKKLYNKYLSMETRILSKLDNVLIQRDFESFISSGYTLSSLDNVWDIVKIEYKNISKEDKEILKEVFAFFLNQINKRFKEAKYGLVQIEVGEGFDAVNQVDLSQNSRGIVTECVFYGYGFLKEKENPNDEDVITRIIKSPLVLTA